MNLPNIFIIGAQKSGTTSLHYYMSQHPEIFMSEPKEPGYFREEPKSQEQTDWYYSLFDGAKEHHKYVGEGSTDYAKIPQYQGVVERIAKVSPKAKIIYVMRSPLKRLVSHYWHTVRPLPTGAQTKDLYQAVKSSEWYLAFSDYLRQITPFIETFGRENIHFIFFEELVSKPKEVLADLFSWLELSDEKYDWAALDERLNSRPEQVVGAAGLGLMHKFSHTKAWDALAKLFPKSLKAWLRSKSVKNIDPSAQDEHVATIANEYHNDFVRILRDVEKLTGRNDLNELWKVIKE